MWGPRVREGMGSACLTNLPTIENCCFATRVRLVRGAGCGAFAAPDNVLAQDSKNGYRCEALPIRLASPATVP